MLRLLSIWLPLVAAAAWIAAPPGGGAAASSFATLADEYLDAFARRHPSIAAGNGLHEHDELVEDFSQRAITAEIADLTRWRNRLGTIDPGTLSADERVDHRILRGIVDGWLLDLDQVQTWRRNPMIYASAVTDGVHNLMVMESAPPEVRIRRIVSKLQGVPALLEAARTNIANPPRVLAERGLSMFRGAVSLLDRDVPLAFASVRDERLKDELRQATARASRTIGEYTRYLEEEVLPKSTGDFAVGRSSLQTRFRAEELIDLPVERLIAIGERELERTEREFRATAARIDAGNDPLAVWAGVLADHPPRGQLVQAAERTVDELLAFVRSKRLVDLPSHDPVVVAPAPEYDLGLASMHSSPPLEARPVRSYYYVTDASPDWPPARQEAWLQKFNYATLADITAHEVYPGHYAHSLFMRRTPGKIRRIWIGLNPFPQPSSGQDGWAHYAEQLIQDEGFHQDDPKYRLAQLSEALTRICRLIVGIRLHTAGWTIEQGAAFFDERAHLPSPAARQEAERGTYDPTYGGYFLGKLAMLKLRQDVAAREGRSFQLRRFHERVLTNGIAPWWAHRQLLLPGDEGAVVD